MERVGKKNERRGARLEVGDCPKDAGLRGMCSLLRCSERDCTLPPLQLFIEKKKHPYAASLLSQTAVTSFREAGGVKPGCAKKRRNILCLMPARSS